MNALIFKRKTTWLHYTQILAILKIKLDFDKAPITAENFLNYCKNGFYNNTIFHRVIDGFMIQGGGMESGMR